MNTEKSFFHYLPGMIVYRVLVVLIKTFTLWAIYNYGIVDQLMLAQNKMSFMLAIAFVYAARILFHRFEYKRPKPLAGDTFQVK